MSKNLQPSFIFSGIDQDIFKLDEELRALGGGDAQLTPMELYTFVNEVEQGDYQILWPYNDSIGLCETSQEKGTSPTKPMTYYPVKGSCKISDKNASGSELAYEISERMSNWINDGFNGCIISLGSLFSGKSFSLFGELGMPSFKITDRSIYNVISIYILHSIFHSSLLSQSSVQTTIAISIWVLQNDKFIDLLSHIAETSDPLDFSSIECRDIHHVISLIHEARARCPGCWAQNDSSSSTADDKADFFIRAMIVKRPKTNDLNSKPQSISYFYLIDLVEYFSIQSKEFKLLSDKGRVLSRKRHSQLSTLFRVIEEMNVMSRKAKASGLSNFDQIKHNSKNENSIFGKTSARNSKLSTLLAPIIQGNMKTLWSLFINDGEKYFLDTKHLLSNLILVSDIVSACYKCKDLSFPLLKYVNHPESYLEIEQSISKPINNNVVCMIEDNNQGFSIDYGDIGLEEILNGNFENRLNVQPQSPLINFKHETTSLKSKGENHNSNNVNSIIGEFQSLLKSIQNKDFKSHFDFSVNRNPSNSSENVILTHDNIYQNSSSVGGEDNYQSIDFKIRDDSLDPILDSPPINEVNNSLYFEEDHLNDSFHSLNNTNFERELNSRVNDFVSPEYESNHLFFPTQVSSSFEVKSLKSKNEDQSEQSNFNKKQNNSFEKTDKLISHISQEYPNNNPPKTSCQNTSDKENKKSPSTLAIHDKQQHFDIENEIEQLILDFDFNKDNTTLKDSSIPSHLQDRLNSLQELEKLQRIRNVLVEKLREEKIRSRDLKSQLELMNETVVEMKAQFELSIDSQNYQIHQLQLKLKKLCHSEDMNIIFSCFESDLARLLKENSMLRDLNLKLENREFEESLYSSSQLLRSKNEPPTYSDQINLKSQHRLYDKLKRMGMDYVKLKKQYEDLKMKERQFSLYEKASRDSNRRLKLTFQEFQKTSKELDKEIKLRLEDENRIRLLEEQCIEFKNQNESLKDERKKLLAEVHMLRNQIYDFERDKVRSVQLDKFVQKHSPKTTSRSTLSNIPLKPNLTQSKSGLPFNKNENNTHGLDSIFLPNFSKQYPISTKNSEVKTSLNNSPGTTNVLYLRKEEAGSLPAEVESTLSALHDSILTTNPSLLPLLRKLSFEIHQERSNSIEQRSKLLDMITIKTQK